MERGSRRAARRAIRILAGASIPAILLGASIGRAAEDGPTPRGADPRAAFRGFIEAIDGLDLDGTLRRLSSAQRPETRSLREEIAKDIGRIRRARARERETLEARAREIRERIEMAPAQERPAIEEWLADLEAAIGSIDRRVRIRIESDAVVRDGPGWAEVRARVDGRAVLGTGEPDDLLVRLVLEADGWKIEGIRPADPKRGAAPEVWDRVSRAVREAILQRKDGILRETLVGPGRPLPRGRAGLEFERLLAALRSAPPAPRAEVSTVWPTFDAARIRVSIPGRGSERHVWELELRIEEVEGGFEARIADVRKGT